LVNHNQKQVFSFVLVLLKVCVLCKVGIELLQNSLCNSVIIKNKFLVLF